MFTLNAVRTKLTKLKITKTKETARLGLIQSFFKAEEQVFFSFLFFASSSQTAFALSHVEVHAGCSGVRANGD